VTGPARRKISRQSSGMSCASAGLAAVLAAPLLGPHLLTRVHGETLAHWIDVAAVVVFLLALPPGLAGGQRDRHE
jgi:hypothetical protein